MKASIFRLLLLCAIGAALLYGLGRWDSMISARDARLDIQTAAALEQADTWRGRLVAAQKHNDELGTELAAAHAAISRSMTEADSIAVIIDIVTLDSSTNYRTLYELRTAEVRRVRAALVASDSVNVILAGQLAVYRTLALEADTTIGQLQQALTDERSARQCRIVGFIPCPSRTTAFIAGAAAGVVLGVALTR